MLIAKIENGQIIALADKHELFPNTSFPTTGPNDEWYIENSCMKVNLSVPYDSNTQQLERCDPYILDGVVYTNKAVEKPAELLVETITINPTATVTLTI